MTSSETFLYYRRYIYLIICVVFLSACANSTVRLYEGVKRPDTEIVTFLLPSALEVVAIDGQKPDTPYLLDEQYQLELLPGEHTLQVIYEEFWGDPISGSVEVSAAFNFQLTTTAGSAYTFKHNGPTDLMNADFNGQINDIRIWLEQRQTGQTINAVSTSAYGNFLARAFQQDTRSVVQDSPVIANKAVQKNDAKMPPAASSAISPTTPPSIAQSPAKQDVSSTLLAEQIIAQQNALERLKLWWKMADEKQRKAFQTWMDKPTSE